MQLKRGFLIFLFYCICVGIAIQSAQSQTNYITELNSDDFQKKYSLKNDYLQFYEDTSDTLSFRTIRTPRFKKNFINLLELSAPLHRFGTTPFNPHVTYWAKVELSSNIDKDSEWILFLGYISQATIYIVRDDGTYETKKAGFFVPNEALEPGEGQGVKTTVHIRKKSKVTLFIQFKNTLNYPPELNLAIQSYKAWQKNNSDTNFIQGVFQGLLWLILLYNFFLFLSVKDKAYFYFVCFVCFISVYYLNEYEYLEEFFLRTQPKVSFYLGNLVYVALVFYILFNRSFFKIPRLYPGWDQILKVWLWMSLLFMLVCAPLAYFYFEYYVVIRDGYHLFYLIALLVFILIVMWIEDAVASLFVLGNFFVLAGGVLTFMGNVGYIPFSLYYLLGGIAAQLFVFTTALSYRFRRSLEETKATQAKLIVQLQENEQLQSKVQRELENKVRERTMEIAQQNEEIETQHEALQRKSNQLESAYKKITDSVRYAQRLQTAILGDEQEILSHFQDGFIVFKPKDMVSGDFYWSTKIGHLRVIIAADCTGHGIPGALMTVLGNSVLNDVVNEEHFTSPEQILYELDKKVVQTIQKQTTGKHPKDGMDMVVVTFDEISYVLKFAGAKNPLYHVRYNEITQIKGSSFPIGIYNFKKEKKFELHEVQALEGDIFYLTSDGFQDQFGGETGGKYMKKRFREFLLSISHLPMYRQKHELSEEFKNWKQNRPQTDDILVVGIKI